MQRFEASGLDGRAVYRGRAYRCKKCSKVDRKGRTIAHVLKHHIPMDEVPFSCSLCNFRCQDKETLLKHIKQYKPHVDAVKKRGGIDHSTVLNRSSNPRYVTENDIELITKEESLRRFRNEDPFDDDESIFDEEDGSDLMLPEWAREKPVNFISNSISPGFVARPLPMSTNPTLAPNQSSTCTTFNSQPLQRHDFHTAQPSNLTYSSSTNFQTINYSDLLPAVISQKNTSTLGKVRDQLHTPVLNLSTPVQDERTTPMYEDILPQLIGTANATDPLMIEAQETSIPAAKDQFNMKRDATTDVPEFETKRRREDSPVLTPAPVVDFSSLVSAMEKSTKAMVEAIDRNSRAIRCQDQTLSQILSSLNRIERTIDRRMDQHLTSTKPKDQGKENKPILKSTVSKVNEKKK